MPKSHAEIFGLIGCLSSQHDAICEWFSEWLHILQIQMVT